MCSLFQGRLKPVPIYGTEVRFLLRVMNYIYQCLKEWSEGQFMTPKGERINEEHDVIRKWNQLHDVPMCKSLRLKISIFCIMTPYSMVKLNWCFGGTYLLHDQGRRTNQIKTSIKQVASDLLPTYFILVDFHRITRRFIPKIEFFIVTSLRTSNLVLLSLDGPCN